MPSIVALWINATGQARWPRRLAHGTRAAKPRAEFAMTQMRHLSIVDGAFLHMESAEMPMHVGSLNLFEPPAGYAGGFHEAVKAHVAKRMHLAPVFTRKLALMPFDLANPVWIHDDDIDLDYHVRYMLLPKPGTLEQLEALAARLHSMLLDRSRPLWEFYVIEGLADGRIGFYGKVHHAAIDGQAGVAMAQSMFELTPEPRVVKPPREARANTYQLGVAELLAAALQNQFQQVVQSLKLLPSLATTLVGAAREAIAERRSESAEDKAARQAETPGTLWKLAPPTPFNHSITNQRAFAAVSLPLGEVKAIGKSLGASINDIVLWLCSTALRSYLKDSRELPDKSLVAAVPISLRQEGDTTANNQVAGTLLDLGTQIADPAERLKAIKRGTAAMKRQMGTFRGVIPTDFPSLGSPWLISGLAALYGRSRIADWLRLTNVTISNVPGSKVPVYLVGAKMTDYYPLSIVVHGVALNITVQSHVDHLCFGLIACRRAVPDVHELGHQLQRAMATLRALTAAPALAAAETKAEVELAPAAAAVAKQAATKTKAERSRPTRAPRAPRLRVVSAAPAAKRKARATAASR
jgi:diacylglycerol O-acyltransferase